MNILNSSFKSRYLYKESVSRHERARVCEREGSKGDNANPKNIAAEHYGSLHETNSLEHTSLSHYVVVSALTENVTLIEGEHTSSVRPSIVTGSAALPGLKGRAE
jgi:hypothetical protein